MILFNENHPPLNGVTKENKGKCVTLVDQN